MLGMFNFVTSAKIGFEYEIIPRLQYVLVPPARWQKWAPAHGSSLDGENTGFSSLSFGRQGFRPINKNTDE